MSRARVAMAISKEVIAQLQKDQENRLLRVTEQERNLIQMLKIRLLELAAIEKSRARQKSRITWLKKRDANNKFFHIMANIRKKKNFIYALEGDSDLRVSQYDKQGIVYQHFLKHKPMSLGSACSIFLN
jgi:transcription-repair coupling factor (superfamily II helicase)